MIPNLTGLQQLVHFTFLLTFFGMIAASVYFFSQRGTLNSSFRNAATLSGIITMVAAMNYYYMKDIYIVGVASGEGKFPTEFRYIDWLITVPLMLVKFPALLGLGPKGVRFMQKLVVLALIMLITGFIGEVNPLNQGMHYGMFSVGMVAWLVVVGLLHSAIKELPETAGEAKAKSVRSMFWFIFLGWIIYPVGYLAPTFGWAPDLRELLYNVGDLVNKVGLGLVVMVSGYKDEEEYVEYEEVVEG